MPIDSSPVIGSDGTILIMANAYPAYLYALNPSNGQQMWYQAVGGSPSNPLASPGIGPDGTIYVPALGGNGGIIGGLAAYTSGGVFKWGILLSSYSAFQYVRSSPSIGPDGTVYFTGEAEDQAGQSQYYLFALNPDGSEKWNRSVSLNQMTEDSTPCIDASGVAYFKAYAPSTGVGELFAVNSSGTKLSWGWQNMDSLLSSPTIFKISNGTAYIAIGTSWGLSLGTPFAAPAIHTWSMFRGNARHTANFADVYTPNHVPNTPVLISPANGATSVSLTSLLLQASAFSDPDAGDTQAASQWQVNLSSDFSRPLWDSGEFAAVTQTTVPSGWLLRLLPNRTYYWRVRYKDSSGGWSAWATPSSFTTIDGPAFHTPLDFDGDGKSDLGCYFAPGGNWYFMKSAAGFSIAQFGFDGTLPVNGDFDGDGKSDYGCYYPPSGNWYFMKSSDGFSVAQFGFAGTLPVTGDFDGDGKADFGCYYPPSGNWYFMKSSAGFSIAQFGFDGTLPVTGDFDGDGITDYGCYYPPSGNWYLMRSRAGFTVAQFGYEGTLPVTGDFDGDGKTDIACYYPPGGNWYLLQTTAGFTTTQFGFGGTLPISGDYDGDGKSDYGCYYPPTGNWYMMQSTAGFKTYQFGYGGTLPLGQ